MTRNSEITKFKIVVIEWLKPNDRKTGKELYDDVLQYKHISNPNVTSIYYSCSSKTEFCQSFKKIEDELEDGEIVTLQIESHGDVNGIGTNQENIISWKNFYDLIRPINIKICGLLFVCLSLCASISCISYIDPYKRAPYLAMIATRREMFPDELYGAFSAFYEKYNNILDIKAFEQLTKEVKDTNGHPTFIMFKAEDIFDLTIDSNRDPENTNHLLNTCYNQGKLHNPQYTFEDAKRDLKRIFDELKTHRDYFSFKDKR